MQEVATQCAQKALRRDAASQRSKASRSPSPAALQRVRGARAVAADDLLKRLADDKNITGGLALSRYFPDRPKDFLVCVTELNSRAEIDALANGLKEVQGSKFQVQS